MFAHIIALSLFVARLELSLPGSRVVHQIAQPRQATGLYMMPLVTEVWHRHSGVHGGLLHRLWERLCERDTFQHHCGYR